MTFVTKEKRQLIQEKLRGIETRFGVRIIYACESGSRAWGFSSPDSDYDIRFLYVRPKEWYLTLRDKAAASRDIIGQIELPIVDDYDFEGWDLFKAMKLLVAGNPTLMEWINSPIKYVGSYDTVVSLLDLTSTYYDRHTSIKNYMGQQDRNYKEFFAGRTNVRYKKYLYIVRPLLACLWTLQFDECPPMRLVDLLPALQTSDTDEEKAIQQLVSAKMAGTEQMEGPKFGGILDKWILDTVKFIRENEDKLKPEGRVEPNYGPVNEFIKTELD